MLTQTACQPLFGKLSDLVGRKVILYTSMLVFSIGSLLCGAAQTMTSLIVARAVAGIGGGGIVNSVWVITSEIVEHDQRAKWSQALSVTWSFSAIAGPLLGGFFSTGASTTLNWRWAFCMNVPICIVAWILVLLSLRGVSFERANNASWQAFIHKFDFIGLLLFMIGTGCVVVGFSFAINNGWTSPSTLSLVILGPLVLALGGFHEVCTSRDALFPPSAFGSSTVVFVLFIVFFHNLAFNAGTFYLALYFQAVKGSTPLLAGIQMLSYSLGSSLASMPATWLIGSLQGRTGDTRGQNWIISTGLLISTLGFGLLTLLDNNTSHVEQVALPLIAGIGIGMLFHPPYQVFSKAVGDDVLATGTSAFFLVRFTGATIGLAVAGFIFDATLTQKMPSGYQTQGPITFINWNSLDSIEPLSLRAEVRHAVAVSIKMIWVVCVPLLGIAFLVSLFMKRYSMKAVSDTQEKKGDMEA